MVRYWVARSHPEFGENDTEEMVGLVASTPGQLDAFGDVVKGAFSLPAASLRTTLTGSWAVSRMGALPSTTVYLTV